MKLRLGEREGERGREGGRERERRGVNFTFHIHVHKCIHCTCNYCETLPEKFYEPICGIRFLPFF